VIHEQTIDYNSNNSFNLIKQVCLSLLDNIGLVSTNGRKHSANNHTAQITREILLYLLINNTVLTLANS